MVQLSRLQEMTAPPNADLTTNTWARASHCTLNAPIDLQGHMDEHGVRFKKNIECVVGESSVSDVEAVIMPLSVPDKSFMFFSRMLVTALPNGCNLKSGACDLTGLKMRRLQTTILYGEESCSRNEQSNISLLVSTGKQIVHRTVICC